MFADIKVQSAYEHDRWLAHKPADRLKGKRSQRCPCGSCIESRIPSSRGGKSRLSVRVDDHEINGATLGHRDVEDEFFMEAVHLSTHPTASTRSGRATEVPLTALIREPRRRKGNLTLPVFPVLSL
jgi:hypothetical protein